MRIPVPILGAALILAALPNLAGSTGNALRTLAVPAPPGAYGPRLTSGDGGIVLSWMEPDGDTAALRYSRLVDGQWQPARTVIDGIDLFVNWADLPSVLAVSEQHWAAHWLEMSGPSVYSYDVRIVQSRDGGENWSAPVTPHRDGTPTEHGFVSLYAQEGMIGALWLDGRNTIPAESHGDHDSGGGGGMTLRAVRIDEDGGLHDEQLVDDLVCDCCQTDVAASSEGLVAVYRDRTAAEIRDIHLSRAAGTAWQAGLPLNGDGWQIGGCPVNGPAVATHGDNVAVVWFTAANDTPVVLLKRSTKYGASFGNAMAISMDRPLGHVDTVVLPDGSTVVSWLAAGDGGYAQLSLRRVSADGRTTSERVVSHEVVARSVPQMVLDGDDLVFAWTERHGDRYAIGSARLHVESLQQ